MAEETNGEILAVREPAYISNSMFDAARGKPASLRPPPSVSVSIADLALRSRDQLAKMVSKSAKRDIVFPHDVPTEVMQDIASVIVERKWLSDPNRLRGAITCFLCAYEPDTYVNNAEVLKQEDEDLWDLFLAQLLLVNPKLSQSLSRKRAAMQGEEPPRGTP
jgi:hypothetical protein